jgi:trans-2,3-dihydro-3-hydroxyanthranilate isomerase
MQRRYITTDVFTDRAFGGNPLAVVLDAKKLSTAQMQAIATEFNYSETTFVLPPADPAHDAQVRIFTVRKELPFAGHPNVGTAFVLATQAKTPTARLVFEEIAGLVPVEIQHEGGKVVGAELTAPQPLKRLTSVSAEQAAACLSLSAFDISVERNAPQIVSSARRFWWRRWVRARRCGGRRRMPRALPARSPATAPTRSISIRATSPGPRPATCRRGCSIQAPAA